VRQATDCGKNGGSMPTISQCSLFLMEESDRSARLPLKITSQRRSVTWMSSVGLSSTMRRSASSPLRIKPMRFPRDVP